MSESDIAAFTSAQEQLRQRLANGESEGSSSTSVTGAHMDNHDKQSALDNKADFMADDDSTNRISSSTPKAQQPNTAPTPPAHTLVALLQQAGQGAGLLELDKMRQRGQVSVAALRQLLESIIYGQ